MVDLGKKLVGTEEGSPSLEDGMGNLQDTVVDPCVVGGEARNEVLKIVSIFPPETEYA